MVTNGLGCSAYEHWHAVCTINVSYSAYGPLGIDILLRVLVRLQAQRHRAFLDRLGSLPLVALG